MRAILVLASILTLVALSSAAHAHEERIHVESPWECIGPWGSTVHVDAHGVASADVLVCRPPLGNILR